MATTHLNNPTETGKHPDAKLTLRECYEKHYFKDDLAESTKALHRYVLSRWERFTENPPVGEIDNEVVARFRQACIDHGYSGATINTGWADIRCILRRLAPEGHGNPWGLGIIPRVPAMRRVKVQRKLPKRVSMEDLSKFYIACRIAKFPRNLFPPAEWWRALIVWTYTTGLRQSDVFGIKLEDIDLDSRTLRVVTQKTNAEMLLPLHDTAIEHAKRIWSDRDLLFPFSCLSKEFFERWHEIREHAGVERFTMHDVRRTAASEIDRVDRGLGKVLLMHAPTNVTERSYLNAAEELREAVDAMRIPIAFKHGIQMAERALKKAQAEQIRMRPVEFDYARMTTGDEWEFRAGHFAFRGRWYRLGGVKLKILQRLVESEGPVGIDDLQAAAMPHWKDKPFDAIYSRVTTEIAKIRAKLRAFWSLPESIDPVPCVERCCGVNNSGVWTILVPPQADIGKGGAA